MAAAAGGPGAAGAFSNLKASQSEFQITVNVTVRVPEVNRTAQASYLRAPDSGLRPSLPVGHGAAANECQPAATAGLRLA